MSRSRWQDRDLWVLGVLCLSALLITTSEFVSLRGVDNDQAADSLERLALTQPWGGYAARQAAAQLNNQWRLDPEIAKDQLAWALSRYPLDPWRWLTLARIEGAQSQPPDQVEARLLAAHSIQPQHPTLNRDVLTLAQRLGEPEAVMRAIRRWLEVEPRAVNEALFTADRWVEDLPSRLPELLPDNEAVWVQAMSYARRNRLPDLAEAVWVELPKPRALGDQALDDYLVHLASLGEFERVQALWAQYDPSYPDTRIPGGHFHVARGALSAFGWDVRSPAGVRIQRQTQDLPPEFRSATWRQSKGWDRFFPGALTLSFDGEHNVNLSTPRIRLPAPSPGQYRVTGWWKAQGLTTRSLPRLEVATLKQRGRSRLSLPNRNFPWTPFELDFEVTEVDETLIIQLTRRRTQAFDRNIEGRLSLTGLQLIPIAPITEEAGVAPTSSLGTGP